GALHLPVTQPAAQLAHQFGLVIPALHVALGEHAAAGIARQLAADFDAPALDERPAFTFLAEAEAFQRGQQVHAETVVSGEDVDVLRRHARHRIHLRGDFAVRAMIEVLEPRPQLRCIDVLLGPAEAAYHYRRLLEPLGHVS